MNQEDEIQNKVQNEVDRSQREFYLREQMKAIQTELGEGNELAEEVERHGESSDAVLYILGHGEALKSPDLKELCERLSEKSGGRGFFPRQAGDLREAFDSILDELSSQYLLAYSPTARAPDGRWHRIRVEVAGGRYDVRARRGYRYDAAAPQPPSFPSAASSPGRPR